MVNDFLSLSKELDDIVVNIDKKVEVWANKVIEHLYGEVYKMTPKLSGNLRDGLVKKAYNGSYAELYFDGDYMDTNGTLVKLYVEYQHENLFANYTTAGTRSKFVEIPFENNKDLYDKWFGQIVGGAVKWR